VDSRTSARRGIDPRRSLPGGGVPDLGRQQVAEFFIYDVYTALARPRWAADVAEVFDRNSDAFPRRDTRWFRDWWYPLRTDTGSGPQVRRYEPPLARTGRCQHFACPAPWFRRSRGVPVLDLAAASDYAGTRDLDG
jgi:hypothetical protein